MVLRTERHSRNATRTWTFLKKRNFLPKVLVGAQNLRYIDKTSKVRGELPVPRRTTTVDDEAFRVNPCLSHRVSWTPRNSVNLWYCIRLQPVYAGMEYGVH